VALRPHLTRGLRLRLALSRSPRLMRRVALPLAGALAAVVLIVLIQWGPRIWTPRPEIDWVEVPAGEFLMGSDPAMGPDADFDEMPPHEVYLDAYRLSRYEITNAQYAQCMRATVCKEPGVLERFSDPDYADHPVVDVSWFDAQEFCDWMVGKLPTEAEWEYAARGPDGRIYPWGDTFDGALLNFCDVNCPYEGRDAAYDDGYERTSPVGSYPDGASWCGASDMAGNVWEWMADWYDGSYYDRSPSRNPTGPSSGEYKVLRSGGWVIDQRSARAANRGYLTPGDRGSDVGFRCVAPPGD
jgi:formylglycine-generating enzyme required for sulfatase activity